MKTIIATLLIQLNVLLFKQFLQSINIMLTNRIPTPHKVGGKPHQFYLGSGTVKPLLSIGAESCMK